MPLFSNALLMQWTGYELLGSGTYWLNYQEDYRVAFPGEHLSEMTSGQLSRGLFSDPTELNVHNPKALP